MALSRAFSAVVRALDVAYDVEERRSSLSVRITAVALSLGRVVVTTLILAAMVVGPLLGGGKAIAVLTAAIWIAVSSGFRAYLELAGSTNAVFGVLGGALTLLFWLYLLAMGLLVGGELNAILAVRHRLHHAPRHQP